MTSTNSLIHMVNTDLGYTPRVVLPAVSLSLHQGDFVGVMGPNGAGKSTLLKSLLSLIPPVQGKVHYDERCQTRLGYVPQRDRLDPIYPLTAFDVVAMGARAKDSWWRWWNAQREARVVAALEKVQMQALAHRSFSELSGGQRQRVLIARALSFDPVALILDEPTSGVDNATEESILGLLSELNKKEGKTILMVTHHVERVRPYTNRFLTVDQGKVYE